MKKTPNHPFALGTVVVSLAALFTGCLSKPAPHAELKPLQGHWEGEGARGKCFITIAGNSLHYRNSAGWYNTTFTLPAETNPQQLHATIQECSAPSSNAIGTIVFAILKIEDGTLLLAQDDMSDKLPKVFPVPRADIKSKGLNLNKEGQSSHFKKPKSNEMSRVISHL